MVLTGKHVTVDTVVFATMTTTEYATMNQTTNDDAPHASPPYSLDSVFVESFEYNASIHNHPIHVVAKTLETKPVYTTYSPIFFWQTMRI